MTDLFPIASQAGRSPRPQAGFTLVELLAVVAILLLLAAVAILTIRSVTEGSKRAKAWTEVTALAVALENYRADHGDYPAIPYEASMSAPVFWGGATTNVRYQEQEGEEGMVLLARRLLGYRNGGGAEPDRAYIKEGQFTVEHSPTASRYYGGPAADTDKPVLVDPWGRIYRYFYDPTNGQWLRSDYILYCMGEGGGMHRRPHKLHEPPDRSGHMNLGHPMNLNNIYGGAR